MSRELLEAFGEEARKRAETATPPAGKKRKRSEASREHWITFDDLARGAREATGRIEPLAPGEFEELIEASREEWEGWT